ncbi:MAG TPA: cytochrome c oxidase subunit 3 [Pirellulaceae bacterium]|nr:cytochrome c oxidase subunit 3 [Pirellulaceae bacterium]HMO92257.1 cytochrome c oxidase subunit 3 [Pirellulaceae bacterium]HMP70073.1 cytochrome c oxidase subunit 3 [Pirellulaceae bacterium]
MSIEHGVHHDGLHGDHHDAHHHGKFIAHHFDSAEQQFDAGKMGIWVFLVTEVLFFSGLFCAYILYRYHHPEIFVQAHHFLDKVLGAGNTIVLLFSSLTMALAVRASQLGQNRSVAIYVLITMVCASIFLGVKAVEYTHKWDMGIFVRSFFQYDDHHHAEGISRYLILASIVPGALLACFGGLALLGMTSKGGFEKAFWGGMAIMVLGYFIGVGGGMFYMGMSGGEHYTPTELHHDIGIFFSIYYCMTGLHAFHVIGGIIALAWIYYRSLACHWRPDYFGPVDNVGLYWHLVDLIWIFLFPLLYLIN